MDEIGIVPAREKDLDLVLGILSDAAELLASKGLPTQWGPGVLSGEKIRNQTRHGEVFLAKLGEETVGTVTLQWSDQIFWKEAPSDAGYMHKLAVRRTYAGRGLGLVMLAWAATQASVAGKKFLRLDCLADNKRIREYYERVGFVHKGDVGPLGWKASLYEKRI